MIKLAPEEVDVVLEIVLGAAMKLGTVLLVAGETPLWRPPVSAQLALGITPGGVEFFDGGAQAA